MRLKIAVFWGLVGGLQAMQEENIDTLLGPEGRMPVLKLARLKQKTEDSQPIDANSPHAQYMRDAGELITQVRLFERQFPKVEISKVLKYYANTYPESYDRFLSRVRGLHAEPALEGDSEDKIVIDFLLLMHEFRYENAHGYKDEKETLVVAKEGLEDEKTVLQQQREQQITKTKYANWRAYGAAAAGFILTLVTGLTTYLARPDQACSNTSTATPAP